MKLCLIIILLIINISGQKKDETIEWTSDTKLVWDNFKGKPDKSSPSAALSSCSLEFHAEFENDSLSVYITNFFNIRQSWVKKDSHTDYLLNHEQKHFDIFEIYARKLRKLITEESFTIKDTNKKIAYLYNKTMKENGREQNKYDSETKHSLDSLKQKEWNEKIENDLKSLEKFAGTKYRIALSK